MFPDAGITKGDLIDYYQAVAPAMLPHLVDRPLTLERFPAGIGGKGFMQKNAPAYFPEFIGRCPIERKDGETLHPVVSDAAGLNYLANQNTVTFHAPTVTAAHLDRPDRLIFDLDPSPDRPDDARAAALIIRTFLDQLELPVFLTTSGSKGYHMVTPLDGTASSGEVAETAQGIARLAVAHAPDLLTLEFQKKNRHDRVFLDWLRNGFGATAVVPWSVRPRPGAPVAMPIAWAELEETQPDSWTMVTAPSRLVEDPWEGFFPARTDLSIAHQAVVQLLESAGLGLETFDRFRS